MVREWSDESIIYYTEDYKLDDNYHYILFRWHHSDYGTGLGDWFDTMLYHFSINIGDMCDIKWIICVDESCLTLAKLFYMAFEKVHYVLVTKSEEGLTPQLVSPSPVNNRFKHLPINWHNQRNNWHELHYPVHTILELCNEDTLQEEGRSRRILLSIGLRKLQQAKDMLIKTVISYDVNNINDTMCVYPDRSNKEQSLLNYSVLNTYYEESRRKNKKILIHFRTCLIGNDEYINGRLNTEYCIQNRDIIKVSHFSLDELLVFSNNKSNTLIMTRCGLCEIMYWLNVKCSLHCIFPPNFPWFFYDARNPDRATYEKLESTNVTTHLKEIIVVQ
tara:strand:+ start:1150 stop:2145 length:996 start_codon:yes stop_codon:yes gene_type:complete